MAKAKNLVRVKSPDKGCSSISVDGVEYEGERGFFEVAPHHAAVLEKRPFNFARVTETAEDREDDEAEGDQLDFARASKAELIDFIRERGEVADRKMSKEQLVDLAESLKDKAPEGEE